MQKVLVSLGLQQYVGIVEQEGLDGGIFVELDEDTFSQEMGVESRIHRLKMMKLIGGHYDVQNLLMGPATTV